MVKTPKTRQSKSQARSGSARSSKPISETKDGPTTVAAKSRHAKTRKEPVTIDLPAENVIASKTSGEVTGNKPKTDATEGKTGSFGRSASHNAESSGKNTPPKPNRSEAPPLVPSRSKSGGIGLVSSAFVGGVVALLGAWALQYAGLISLGNDNSNTSISALQSDSDAFAKSLNSLSEEVKTIRNESGTFITEQKMAAAIAAQQSSDSSPDLSSITTLQKQVDDLGNRISGMNDALSSANSTSENSAIRNTDLIALENKVATLAATITAMPSSAISVEEMAPIEAQLAKLNDSISSIAQSDKNLRAEIDSVQAVLAKQKLAIDAVAQKAAEGGSQKVAAAIALNALKNDVDRGLPFARSLQQFRSITSADNLAELSASAETGIPTSDILGEDFRTLSRAILQTRASDESQGAVARLIASAKSFANVKPLNPIEGDTLDALVSQIEFALKSGDLQSAHTHWTELPEKAKAVSSDWHSRLKIRIDSDHLLSRPIQDYLSN